jgi:hypothetical protein
VPLEPTSTAAIPCDAGGCKNKTTNNQQQKKVFDKSSNKSQIDSVMNNQYLAFAITFRKFDQITGQPYEFTQGVEIECDDEQHGREILTRAYHLKPAYIVSVEVIR